MTDTLLDPNDSGEIQHSSDWLRLGEGPTTDLRHHLRRDTTGEATQNIGQYARPDVPFGYLRKTIDATDTVVFHIPETIGLAGPDQPKPPSPLPPPPTKLDPETGVNIFGGLGADLPDAAFPGYVGRHRHPEDQAVVADERRWLSPWGAVALIAVVGLAIWVGLTLAAAAVIW